MFSNPNSVRFQLFPLPDPSTSTYLVQLIQWINAQIKKGFPSGAIYESEDLTDDDPLRKNAIEEFFEIDDEVDIESLEPDVSLLSQMFEILLLNYFQSYISDNNLTQVTIKAAHTGNFHNYFIGNSDTPVNLFMLPRTSKRVLWVKVIEGDDTIAAVIGYPRLYTLLTKGYQTRGFSDSYFDEVDRLFEDVPGLVWVKDVSNRDQDRLVELKILIIAEKAGDYETLLDTSGVAWNVTFEKTITYDDRS